MSLSMYTLDLCILLGTTLMVAGVKIQNVGTNLVWSHDYELDMRGHCSFTFSVAYCGAFKLELYPDKDLPEPKYEIYIDRYSLEKYKVGIRKSCDAAHLLCSNEGMGTSGHENTPLVICDGSTWTPFWISWFGGVITLGKGTNVGEAILKEVSDPQFKHIDYVKMGADNETTEANYRFAPRDGRPIDPDVSCRNIATTSVAPVATATTHRTTTSASTTPSVATATTHGTTTAATTTTPAATTPIGGPTTAETTTTQATTSVAPVATATTHGTTTAAKTTTPAATTPIGDPTTAETITAQDAATITAPTATTQTDGSAATSATATSAATTQTGGPEATFATAQTFVKMTVNNCDNERRPYSEDLAMVFEVAADDTTLSPTNPDIVELSSATSGSCAELCASRKTCVMYSISNTGTCRITSACQSVVEGETNSAILFLKYWG